MRIRDAAVIARREWARAARRARRATTREEELCANAIAREIKGLRARARRASEGEEEGLTTCDLNATAKKPAAKKKPAVKKKPAAKKKPAGACRGGTARDDAEARIARASSSRNRRARGRRED